MPFLPGLSVVFVGIAGGGAVDHQVGTVIEAAHVQRANLPMTAVRTLARHADGAHDLVARMHVDGVISGEVVVDHGQASLHLVIYNGEGTMKSYNEISIAGRALTKSELEMLRANLDDEITALAPRTVKQAALADPFANAEIEMAPAPTRALPPPAPHEAAPVQTASADADAVGADEIAALMTKGSDIDAGVTTGGGTAAHDGTLHLGADVGFGFASRSFSPGPATVAAYASSPVGALRAAGHVDPIDDLRLAASIEHTLSMSTPLAGGVAATQMGRWEVEGAYALTHGTVELRARAGLGHRSFSIESTDPGRSPDGDYSYLIAGATAAVPIGERFRIEGGLAFEPVVGGAEPTMMAFGAASRWALDAAIAAEVRPTAHVFVRAALDYQRFAWSWDAAGARGAGGAVDSYPSGTVSVGAHY